MEESEDKCPECCHEMDGQDCNNCGFSYFPTDANEYETPEGNIVRCTEDQAMEKGYILWCPLCKEELITWWELEDHGTCITCWHKINKSSLTE